MNIYWLIVFLVIFFGLSTYQGYGKRKNYIFLMTAIHLFFCGFRYQFLSGDLIKYNTAFRHMGEYSYFSDAVLNEWQNTGFLWLMKFFSDKTGNYQLFLFFLAVVTIVLPSIVIYKYSTKPWLSYLVWNCFTFYVLYGFIAIKQGLAMAILMLSVICIFESKPVLFLIFTLIAGFFHFPALVFLPAYFVANRKVNFRMIILYFVFAAIVFAFRDEIVSFMGSLYYDDTEFVMRKNGVGGRTIVIVLILAAGYILKGLREKRFSQLFNLIVISAILQMFSVFSNVFTRLADYYLQFLILYIPDIFYKDPKTEIRSDVAGPILCFDSRSKPYIIILLVAVLIWWYYTTCLGTAIDYSIDNFLNYRFMWQVG